MTIQQETIDLFERNEFSVMMRNNGTHVLLDHASGRLHISYWPTTGTWMAWGRVWKNSTPEEVMAAFQIGRLWMPREIQLTVANCQRCHEMIWWAKTTKGKKMPVNQDGSRHPGTCALVSNG